MKFSQAFFLLVSCILLSSNVLAVDGVSLINQATVMAAGGFPYHITQSGSYKLSGNLVVASTNLAPFSFGAIVIDADNVSLDLNGFSIIGPDTCTAPLSSFPQPVSSCADNLRGSNTDTAGIYSSHDNVTVYNGSVRGMGFGVELLGNGERVEGINTSQNVNGGIEIDNGIVRRCDASRNGGFAITANGVGSVIESNVVNLNASGGIVVSGGNVSANTVSSNGGFGVSALAAIVNLNNLIGNQPSDLGIGPQALSNHNNNCSGVAC